jgi:hypothetical protein
MSSYGVFDCPYCLDTFYVVGWPIPKLHKNTRVFVQCPGPCGKEISVYAFEIDGVLSGEPSGVCTKGFRLGGVEKLYAGYVRTMTLTHSVRIRKNGVKYGFEWRNRIPKEILEKSIYAGRE